MKKFFWYLSVLLIFIFSACEKDDPEVVNEEELITTLTYTLTPMSGGSEVVFNFQDLDGDGGDSPVLTEGLLAANTTYIGVLKLLNEQETPPENITEEVVEEALEHQFFFQNNVSGMSISYADNDSGGNPLGVQSTLTTGDSGNGTMTIILRHEPDKSASGVADGNIANAGGETDIEVTFTVNVQ